MRLEKCERREYIFIRLEGGIEGYIKHKHFNGYNIDRINKEYYVQFYDKTFYI